MRGIAPAKNDGETMRVHHPMLTATKSLLLAGAACTLAIVLPAPRALAADTLSWNNVTYNPGAAAATTKTNIATVNGNTISLQFGNSTYFKNDVATTPSPSVGTYTATAPTAYNGTSPTFADGGFTGNKALQIFANFDNAANNIIAGSGIPVTVFFSKPVSNLIFSFYDVDGNNATAAQSFNDQVTNIFGLGTGGGSVAPISLTGSSSNAVSNGGFLANNTPSANNTNGGNATVTFGNTPITQFTFTYTDPAAVNGGTAHNAQQIIALGDLTFTTVPEPSTWACFVMAGGLGVWTLRRRARRMA